MAAPNCDPPARLQRLVAALSIALVLLLGTASTSPSLHDWVHDHAEAPGHTCAVALFAHGITLAGAAVLPGIVRTWVRRFSSRAPEEVLLAAPRFLRQPERGPPEN